MGELASIAIRALDPLVGPMAASTCVRGTALSLGKMSDDLDAADWPALQANIRKLLSPVAPDAIVSQIISEIERDVR